MEHFSIEHIVHYLHLELIRAHIIRVAGQSFEWASLGDYYKDANI